MFAICLANYSWTTIENVATIDSWWIVISRFRSRINLPFLFFSVPILLNYLYIKTKNPWKKSHVHYPILFFSWGVCVFRVLSRLSWCFICIIIVQENSGFFCLLCYFSCARQFCLFLVVHLLWNERNEMNRLSRLIYCYYFLCFCFVRARERKTSVQWIKEKSVLLILCSIIP